MGGAFYLGLNVVPVATRQLLVSLKQGQNRCVFLCKQLGIPKEANYRYVHVHFAYRPLP